MAKLILKSNSKIIKEFELDDSGQNFIFGSGDGNDFVISNKNVAGNHFKIENANGSYYLEDLKTSIGTYLNGRPIFTREQLVHGDEISIDELNLYFHGLPDNPKKDLFEEKAIELIGDDYFNKNISVNVPTDKQEQSKTQNFYEIEELSEDPESQNSEIEMVQPKKSANGKSYYLLAIHGPYLGKNYPLKFGDTKIGRDNILNDVVIRTNEKGVLDPSISRRHATVTYKKGNFFVTDKRSKTRTYVNQIKLSATDEIPVFEGDEIEIVSDQKSTILRMLSDGDFDSSPPKKAGPWWNRNNLRMGTLLSIILGIITFGSLGLSYMTQISANKKPDQLKFIEESWFQKDNSNEDLKGNHKLTDSHTLQANIAITDLNGDQKLDLIFTNNSGKLIALDGVTKKTIWTNEHIQVLNNVSIVLSDLNTNGFEDVLVVGQDIRLRALDGTNGAEIWLSPILGEDISGPPTVADINGDGLKDILICTQSGKIHIGYAHVTQIDWKVIETGQTVLSVPSSADWDNDGINEIFLGTEEGKVLIIDGSSGNIAKIFDFSEEISKTTGNYTIAQNIRYPIAFADIDQNRIKDLIIGSVNGNFLAMESFTLSRIWHEYIPIEQSSIAGNIAATVGKCNEDEIDDVVVVSNQQIKLLKGSADPQRPKIVSWEFKLEDDVFITPATLADFDKDHANDIIIGSEKGTIYILNGKNGEVISEINNENNPVISPLLVADLGSNGYLDIVSVRQDHNIYKIQSNSKINKDSVIWGQLYSNAQHTGRYEYRNAQSTMYNIFVSTTGLLFLGIIILTVSGKKNRQRIIRKNQHS